jgi:serine phosphatase RsbU (regulator of sigma subunit)
MIEDLGSGNGTFINGRRIKQCLLKDRDQISISDCCFQFVSEKKPERQWVSMVTVIADNDTDLVSIDSNPWLAKTEDNYNEQSMRLDLIKAHRTLEALYSVTDETSSELEPSKLFRKILDCLFHVFPNADRGFIMKLNEHNQLVPGAVRRRMGEGVEKGLVLSQSIISQVMLEGKSVISDGIPQETLSTNVSSTPKICAPLQAQGKILGILHIEGSEGSKPFSQEDLDLLTVIARQAGVTTLNAEMHQRLMRQQRLEQDLQFARQVQQSFLPSEPPEIDGYHFNRRYQPFFAVGGDFYDFILLPSGKIGVLIGDVSGKGVSAALLMARLTTTIRFHAIHGSDPAEVLDRTNQSLVNNVQDNMFATVLYVVLDPQTHQMTISNAGHIPPFIRRQEDGSVQSLDEATNLALGVLLDAVFEQVSYSLYLGDSVLLCTDGVVEAKNKLDQEFGFQRLEQAISSASASTVMDTVFKDLMRYSGTAAQYDDLTLVVFSREL